MTEPLDSPLFNVIQALRQGDLRFDELEGGMVRLLFRGASMQEIIVCIRADEEWVQFYSLFSRQDGALTAKMATWLLRTNHELPLVRFSLNPNGDVLLQSDVPTPQASPRLLQTVVRALIQASEQYYGAFLAR